jgi:hypothetical protein
MNNKWIQTGGLQYWKGKLNVNLKSQQNAPGKSETHFRRDQLFTPKKSYSTLLNFDVWALVQAASTVTNPGKHSPGMYKDFTLVYEPTRKITIVIWQ